MVRKQRALTLAIPAIAVTLVFFAVLFGVPESTPLPGRRLDVVGFSMLTVGLLLITSGFTFLRLNGLDASWVYILIVLGLLAAQAPPSAYAGTDPANGYGLGLDSGDRSTLIGVYLISMIGGALLFPLVSRWFSPRVALIIAAFLVAIGYLLFVPFHLETWQVFLNMFIAGSAWPDRHRRRTHQHDQDDLRVVRLGHIRHRLGNGCARRSHEHGLEPRRLSHRVDHVRDRCPGGCRAALLRAEGRVRGCRGRVAGSGGDRPHRVTGERYSFGASAPRITLCGAACATGLMVTRSRFTNPGSSIECTIASATSSACKGFATLS